MVGGSAPRGGALKYFTPNINLCTLFDPKSVKTRPSKQCKSQILTSSFEDFLPECVDKIFARHHRQLLVRPVKGTVLNQSGKHLLRSHVVLLRGHICMIRGMMYVVQVYYLHIGHLWVVGHILKADWSVGYSVVVATSKKTFSWGLRDCMSPMPTCSTPATALMWFICATTSWENSVPSADSKNNKK